MVAAPVVNAPAPCRSEGGEAEGRGEGRGCGTEVAGVAQSQDSQRWPLGCCVGAAGAGGRGRAWVEAENSGLAEGGRITQSQMQPWGEGASC